MASNELSKESACEVSATLHVKLSDEEFGGPSDQEALGRVEEVVLQKVMKSGTGQFDGNEYGGGWYRLYLYGSQCDPLTKILVDAIRFVGIQSPSYVVCKPDQDRPGEEVVWINSLTPSDRPQ